MQPALHKGADRSAYASWWRVLAVIPWLAGLVFLLSALIEDRAIAKRQHTVIGRVTLHDPANHDRYGYTFSVDGQDYSGWEIPRGERSIGDTVLVYYDPLNPRRNALVDFAEVAEDDKHPVLFVAFGAVSIPALLYMRRRQARAAAEVHHPA